MKPRERRRPELAAVPPLELRLWDDPSQQHDRAVLGCGAYATREEWVAARRAWEAEHGLALQEWFHLVCEDALHRGGLDAMNDTFGEYLTEPEDWADPRTAA